MLSMSTAILKPFNTGHNPIAATFLRKEFGLETARIILGHRSAAITEVYAELDQQTGTGGNCAGGIGPKEEPFQ